MNLEQVNEKINEEFGSYLVKDIKFDYDNKLNAYIADTSIQANDATLLIAGSKQQPFIEFTDFDIIIAGFSDIYDLKGDLSCDDNAAVYEGLVCNDKEANRLIEDLENVYEMCFRFRELMFSEAD